MRCKKHFSDVSSNIGVCASCLRECLLSLIDRAHKPEDRRISDHIPQHRHHHPPPILFPRSVSPYISRRKSDTSDYRQRQDFRFFSTPQVDLTTKKKKSKFHMISNFFRSRSSKSPQLPDPSTLESDRQRKVTLRLFSLNEFNRNRGMSPDVQYDSDDDSPSPIGCSPEPWRKTPSSGHGATRPSHARARASPARSHVASGIGICLSPLMRPSPIRQWNGKGVGPGSAGEAIYSGEVRSTAKPHLSTASSFFTNRSRKLADFGKFNHNR